MALDTQLGRFAENYDAAYSLRKQELATQNSMEILMTQAKEEGLPQAKSKRKKDKSDEPNRISVQFAKPSTSEMTSHSFTWVRV